MDRIHCFHENSNPFGLDKNEIAVNIFAIGRLYFKKWCDYIVVVNENLI